MSDTDHTEVMGGNAMAALKRIVERVERLNEERAALGADIADIFKEAKGTGFDVKAIRHLIRERKKAEDKRREERAILETYAAALDMTW